MTNSSKTPTRKTFRNAGLTLSYLDNDYPSADLPIVLLHGFTASAEINWLKTGWIGTLTCANRRVIALDARGHGESDKPYDSRYYPSHIMMKDSVALLNQLGFSQADFIGFSMGARMSTFVAANYPKLVRKLVIGGLGIRLKTGASDPVPIAAALRTEDPNSIDNRQARRFRLFAEKGGNDLEAMAYCILSSREPITDELLAKITAKTLIIVGDQDLVGGDPYALQPSIANSQAVQVPDCTHFNALSHDTFCQHAMRFIMDD